MGCVSREPAFNSEDPQGSSTAPILGKLTLFCSSLGTSNTTIYSSKTAMHRNLIKSLFKKKETKVSLRNTIILSYLAHGVLQNL